MNLAEAARRIGAEYHRVWHVTRYAKRVPVKRIGGTVYIKEKYLPLLKWELGMRVSKPIIPEDNIEGVPQIVKPSLKVIGNTMSKYKLIKKLPFDPSPELGFISEVKEPDSPRGHYWSGVWFNPEDFPEHWEKVSVYYRNDVIEVLEIKDGHITKVKDKKRDFEISVGDKVFLKSDDSFPREVKSMTVEIGMKEDRLLVAGDFFKVDISKVEPRRALGFTEDGMMIFKDTPVWFMHRNVDITSEIRQTRNYIADPKVYYFSSFKAAEEFRFYNTKSLSLQDIIDEEVEDKIIEKLIVKVKIENGRK